MKTVLLAWELGGGMGHVASMGRLASRLKREGTRLVAAIRRTQFAGPLEQLGVEVIQSPPWMDTPLTREQQMSIPSVTMGDLLAALGLADENRVRTLVRAWAAILDDIKPDMMIADYAPTAALVARGRMPLILTGNGYTLPPSEMKRFPLLHRLYPPRWREQDILGTINRAAREWGCVPLERLPQLFSGDARFVETFPLLDPYDLQRLSPADGPVFDSPPIARQPDAQRIFVYISPGYEVHPDLVRALRPFAKQLAIHAPEMTAEQTASLGNDGARIHPRPIALRDVLPETRLVIHLGGTGLAAEAIATGVPQLILAVHNEHALNGAALESAGIGRLVRTFDPSFCLTAETISDLLGDDDLMRRAAHSGAEHRAMLSASDPLDKFEAACMGLLGG